MKYFIWINRGTKWDLCLISARDTFKEAEITMNKLPSFYTPGFPVQYIIREWNEKTEKYTRELSDDLVMSNV